MLEGVAAPTHGGFGGDLLDAAQPPAGPMMRGHGSMIFPTPFLRGARSQQPLACVMGSMDLVRPLGLAGIRCAVVSRHGAPSLYSRFTQAVLRRTEFYEDDEDLVETLMRFGAAQAERPVLFYEEDA